MSQYDALLLATQSSPAAVFVDEQPYAFEWPTEAAFALYRNDRWEFFGDDGWPIGLPEECKVEESESLKLHFQTFPSAWRTWSPDTLASMATMERRKPGCHAQSHIGRAILSLVPNT